MTYVGKDAKCIQNSGNVAMIYICFFFRIIKNTYAFRAEHDQTPWSNNFPS